MVLGDNTGTCASVNLSEMPGFPTTRLSLVLAVAAEPDAQYGEALGALCEIYWQPLYAFIRRRGYGHEAAQDLTQSFIARLLEKKVLREFRQERGRFRSFLLASLKNFLANERDAEQAQKRGGAAQQVPISQIELLDDTSPDAIFEKQWAVALVNRVFSQLQEEFRREGKADRFGRLSVGLTGDESRVRYREIARQLGMSEGAVRVAIHRLRRRFHEALRDEISMTVTEEREISEEIRHLLSALQG
jgi:RNA polymerase sigma-70 factor (ECF subfamily)